MLDLLFLSWNRWEFTEVALDCLIANTDWGEVNKLIVYDDGSEVETVERLVRRVFEEVPHEDVEFRSTGYRSPVAVMVDYLKDTPSDIFVKIDNDVAVPPGWLGQLAEAWSDDVDLLGMELGMPPSDSVPDPPPVVRTAIPTRHIGGVGMMRTEAFGRRFPKPNGRFGFTEWQHIRRPRRAWVFPEIDAVCLDRLPVEPWVSLSREYEQRGWQRPWWKYSMDAKERWEWMTSSIV